MVDIEKRREQQRKAAERKRRKNGIKQWKGTPAECEVCGKTYIRAGMNSKTCSTECGQEMARKRARERGRRLLRERGAPQMGERLECGHCHNEFSRDVPRVKYCQDCRILQKKGALPEMRKKYLEYRKSYEKERRAVDPVFDLTLRVRGSIADSIKRMGYTKRNRCHQILGCDWQFLKGYIEAKFWPGMTWENRGQWEIDHIVPISSAVTEDDVIRLNHYTNLQPLWASDNRSKGAKMDWQPEER